MSLKIGPYVFDGPYLLAPMAGLVSTPFRGICLEHGAAAAPTELISATALARKQRRTVAMVERAPHEPVYWPQLFGADPLIMARAAVNAVELGAQVIDINMGCPVRKVTRDGAGSALMQDPDRALRIVKEIRVALGDELPVTAKIRAGWDAHNTNAVEFGQALEQAGVAALCLHARTRAQRYSGLADWKLIAALRQVVQLPLIGNGDVGCVEDAQRMLDETGCDGVMVGRAALGNPWVFTSLKQGHDVEPSPAERNAVVQDHLQRLFDQVGDEERAVKRFRSRMLSYARGLDGGIDFKRRIVQINDMSELRETLQTYFSQAQRARGYRPGRAGLLKSQARCGGEHPADGEDVDAVMGDYSGLGKPPWNP